MNPVYEKWDRFCDQNIKEKYLEYEEAVIKYKVIVAKINDIYENEYKQAKAELDVAEATIQEYLDVQYLWEPPPMKSDRLKGDKQPTSGEKTFEVET